MVQKMAAAKKTLQTAKFAGAQRGSGDYWVPTTKNQVPTTAY